MHIYTHPFIISLETIVKSVSSKAAKTTLSHRYTTETFSLVKQFIDVIYSGSEGGFVNL